MWNQKSQEIPQNNDEHFLFPFYERDQPCTIDIESRRIFPNFQSLEIKKIQWQISYQQSMEPYFHQSNSSNQLLNHGYVVSQPLKRENHISKYVFNELDQRKVQKRNTNFIKFLLKAFFRSINSLKKKDQQYDKKWIAFNRRLRKKLFSCENQKARCSDLMTIFSNEVDDCSSFQRKNKQFLRSMLRNSHFAKEYILMNNFMKEQNKRQYLLSSKVFALRCRSNELLMRKESR